MKKPKIGDKLWLVSTNPYDLFEKEVEIISVGIKYFKVSYVKNKELIFYIKTSFGTFKQKTSSISRYSLYESKGAYLDLEKKKKLMKKFKDVFSFNWFEIKSNDFTLDQLEKAAKILDLKIED
jgi:hypothetical protein